MVRFALMVVCLFASAAYAGADRPVWVASDEAPAAAPATLEPPAPSLAKAYVRTSWIAPTGAVLTVLGAAGGILAFGLDPGHMGAAAWTGVAVALAGDAMAMLGLSEQRRLLSQMGAPFRNEMRRMAYISGAIFAPVALIAMLSWGGALGIDDLGGALLISLLGSVAMVGAGGAAICVATATAIMSEKDRQAFRKRPVASVQIVPTWGRGPGLALVGTF